jgi:hypothetical protein
MRLTFRLLAPAVVLMVGGGLGLGGAQAQGPGWYINSRALAGIGAQGTGGRTNPDEASSFYAPYDGRASGSYGVGPGWSNPRARAGIGAQGTGGRTNPREAASFYAPSGRRGGGNSYPAPRVYYYPAPPVYYYPAPPVYYYTVPGGVRYR